MSTENSNDPTLAAIAKSLAELHAKMDDVRARLESYKPTADAPGTPSDEGMSEADAGTKGVAMSPTDIAKVYAAIPDEGERRRFAVRHARALRRELLTAEPVS
jgi:hypothetical protein